MEGNNFDFLIVGSGAAGCAAAERLSRNGKFSVLLLEAGGDNSSDSTVKNHLLWIKTAKTPEFNWPFQTEKQINNKIINMEGGKMLGGSTSHNAQMWVRGNVHDFDEWEKYGHGWGRETMIKTYKQIESYEGKDEGGFVNLVTNKRDHFVECFEKSAIINKVPFTQYNSNKQLGWGLIDFSVKFNEKGEPERHSSYQAFVQPNLNRKNLTVKTNSVVTRVIIEEIEGEPTAVGVELIENGEKKVLKCNKEVLLACGAIKSPHLLMLSGIGEKHQLEKFNIKVWKDLPGVGKNLVDHVFIPFFWSSKKRLPENKFWGNINGYGRNDGNYDENSGIADYQFIFLNEVPHFPLPTGYEDKPLVFGAIAILHPYSNGSVQLKSSDPLDHPFINPNYLQDPRDLITAQNAFNELRRLIESEPMKDYINQTVAPLSDSNQIREYILNNYSSMWHPASTVRMGNGYFDCLDHLLQVRGVKRLRVIDASVMPTLTSGNTQAPTMAIGFHAAELILEKYN